MRGFITEIVTSLYTRYGDALSEIMFVFPSRRARLFFSDALAREALRPMWQPRFVTIDELMQRAAGIMQSEQLRLITELYKVYSRYHTEAFDTFYHWGTLLLADFDAIDKYMIDADMLFANMSDLRALEDDFSYFTPEQKQIITQFWRNFGLNSEFSREKEHFLTIWKTLGVIYHEFRETLLKQGLAYTGMVHRLAAENLRSKKSVDLFGESDSNYVIAGFNALSECEKILFDRLKNSGGAEFYWDYDNYYVRNQDHEAGTFLRENILRYPSPELWEPERNHFVAEKEVVAVSAPSDSLQCKYVYTFLQELLDSGQLPDKDTAIVLTDESLLVPVLYSIPEEIPAVNVTMGYPLRQITAYSFVERLIELQRRSRIKGEAHLFYHSDVEGILNHPFIQEHSQEVADDIITHIRKRQQVYIPRDMFQVQGVIEMIFSPVEGWRELSVYLKAVISEIGKHISAGEDVVQRREFFSVIIDNLYRLENSLIDCDIEISVPVYASLLRKILQEIRIPYEGEPLNGVQIMGILETRNLDFRNVLVLSANDDTFPGNRAVSSSFIPYNLRVAYGLPTPRNHESVYGFYFYRLIQRAEKVHLAYCSRSDDKRTGEPSRYIYQLRYESPHNVLLKNIPLNVSHTYISSISIPKTGDIVHLLSAYLEEGGRELSPTAMNAYVECPLKFYFRYIAGVKPEEEIVEDIDLPMFGTILHKAMELLYAGFVGVSDINGKIAALQGSNAVDMAVRRAINEEYLRESEATEDQYGGNVVLVRDIVRKYINDSILPYDAAQQPFSLLELEKRIHYRFAFDQENKSKFVNLGGTADRIDHLQDGTIRVVDYKTGTPKLEFDTVDALFSEVRNERNSAVLQTLLYSLMLYEREGCDVQPALYYVRWMNRSDYSPLLQDGKQSVERFSTYELVLTEKLREVLAGLFDMTQPFVQCTDTSTCIYCDFKQICRRQEK